MSAAEIQRLAKFFGNFLRFFFCATLTFPLFHFSTCNRKVLLSWAKIHFSIIYIIIYIILIYNIFTFPKPWISFELFFAMAELKRASFYSFGLRKTFKSKVEKWKSGKPRLWFTSPSLWSLSGWCGGRRVSRRGSGRWCRHCSGGRPEGSGRRTARWRGRCTCAPTPSRYNKNLRNVKMQY